MPRRLFFALLACLPLSTRAGALRAQRSDNESVGGLAIGVGYIVLSIAAVHRMSESRNGTRVGDSVRIRWKSRDSRATTTGRLTAIDADSITVVAADTAWLIPRARIRAVDAHMGRERKWAQGFTLGFAAGGMVGAIAGLAQGADRADVPYPLSAKAKAILYGFSGGTLGSVAGSAIGLGIEGDRWVSVDRIPARDRVSVAPFAGRRVGLAARLSF